jgi:hypothetical protein
VNSEKASPEPSNGGELTTDEKGEMEGEKQQLVNS